MLSCLWEWNAARAAAILFSLNVASTPDLSKICLNTVDYHIRAPWKERKTTTNRALELASPRMHFCSNPQLLHQWLQHRTGKKKKKEHTKRHADIGIYLETWRKKKRKKEVVGSIWMHLVGLECIRREIPRVSRSGLFMIISSAGTDGWLQTWIYFTYSNGLGE